MTPEQKKLWDRWIDTKPMSVRILAHKFPLGTVLEMNGERYYLLGYTEEDMLIVSKINPFASPASYDEAQKHKEYVHAHHFEGKPVGRG